MELLAEVAQFDLNLRCRCMAMYVGERFLHDAKETPLQFKGRGVGYSFNPDVDAQSGALPKPVGIAFCGLAKAIIIEPWRMQEIGKRAEFL